MRWGPLVAIWILALAGPTPAGECRVVTGFDYSPDKRLERVGEDHFAVDFAGRFCNWFMFKVEGAKGRTLTIDLKNVQIRKWKTLNPVYSYVEDLSDPESFRPVPFRGRPARPLKARNGPLIPDTRGQKWHFISHVQVEGDTLRLTQRFDEDSAWVAMKYPYTCEYAEKFSELISRRGGICDVAEIGRSKEGRPIKLVKIGKGGEDRKPCVLIYAREHPTEHDTSWVAEGAMLFLLSNAPEARAIRQRFTFLVIPILDPDGAVGSKYVNITYTFVGGYKTPESLAIAGWFKEWVDQARRLDLVFSLHNVESNETKHLVCAIMEPERGRLGDCRTLNDYVLKSMKGFDLVRNPWQRGYRLFRLAGFVGLFYGTLPMYYEVNSQAPSRHLTLGELREMGARFVRASARYLSSSRGARLLAGVGKLRRERTWRWRKYGHQFEGKNALYSEEWCNVMPSVVALHREKGYDVSRFFNDSEKPVSGR